MKKIVYKNPSSEWLDATPLGNGFLGAMVFGKTDKEVVYFNEDSCVSNGPLDRLNKIEKEELTNIRELLKENKVEEAQKLATRAFFATSPQAPHFEPLGQYWMEYKKEEISNYRRELDLSKAILSIEYNTKTAKHNREFFVSHPDNVSIYKLVCDKQEINFDLYLTRRDGSLGRSSSFADEIISEDKVLYLSSNNGSRTNGLFFTMAVAIKTDGNVQIYGTRYCVENASEVIIYAVARTSYRDVNPKEWCKKQINNVINKDYELIKEEHIKDYSFYFDRFELKLSDDNNEEYMEDMLLKASKGNVESKLWETYFNFGRYLLIACSREDTLPANLQGIWNMDFAPYWGSRYTININTQMNYWFSENTGLGDMHLALMNLIKVMYPNAKRTARDLYHMKGAVAHHNTDVWGDCAPTDYYVPSTIWPYGYMWFMLHVMDHYQYNHNEQFIKEFFPIIKDNVAFIIDYLFKFNDKYQTGPSVSPENTYKTKDGKLVSVCMSPEMDIAMIKEFFKEYLRLLDTLNINDYRIEVEERLNNLPETKITKYNTIREWQEDYDETELGHRHISQLFGLYPGHDENFNTIFANQSFNTINRRLTNGGGSGGWSSAWIACWYARLHKSNEAVNAINRILSEYTSTNLFSIGTGVRVFQVDGNFGIPAAMLECIIQDYYDKLFILPSVNNQLNSGSIRGYLTKCGALIDLLWKNGKLQNLKIHANRKLKTNLVIDGNVININLEKDQEYNI